MKNDVDKELELAAFIREIDGNNSLGASQLAERIVEWQAHAQHPSTGYKKAAQIGKVVGVLVENEAGRMATVHDLGRVTWLDDYVAGPVAQEEDHDTVEVNASAAAIRFALEDDEGMAFLACWNEGDFESIRREWPDAPEEVFIGADPLYRPKVSSQ